MYIDPNALWAAVIYTIGIAVGWHLAKWWVRQ